MFLQILVGRTFSSCAPTFYTTPPPPFTLQYTSMHNWQFFLPFSGLFLPVE